MSLFFDDSDMWWKLVGVHKSDLLAVSQFIALGVGDGGLVVWRWVLRRPDLWFLAKEYSGYCYCFFFLSALPLDENEGKQA